MDDTVSLRSATRDDWRTIAALHAASWRHAYREALGEAYLRDEVVADRERLWRARFDAVMPGRIVLVAEEGDRLAGFACACLDDDARYGTLLDNIHVDRARQGRGIGGRLLGAIAAGARAARPAAGLYLWVLEENRAAQGFYRRHGAHEAGTDVWQAPGGNRVPRLRYAWSPGALPAAI